MRGKWELYTDRLKEINLIGVSSRWEFYILFLIKNRKTKLVTRSNRSQALVASFFKGGKLEKRELKKKVGVQPA